MPLVNYKIKLLIDSLSSDEIDQFRKFISTPYYNKGRNYLPFLDKVIEIKKNPDKLNEKELSIHISGKKLSDQTIRNRYSELYKLGEEFLISLWLTENKIEKEKILLKKLIQKKLYSPFGIKYKETFSEVENEKFDPSKLKILSELREIHAIYLIEIDKERLIYNEHYEYSKQIFCHFLIQIFEMGFEFIQEEIDSIKFSPNYIKEYLNTLNIEKIISEFKDSDILMFKLTAMNYYLYKANIGKDDEQNFFISHKIFSDHFDLINEKYKIKIFTIMINFCIQKLNDGNTKYQLELFKLYKEKLSQDLTEDLKYKSYSFNHFRDFVFIGIAVEDYDWVENFIQKYSKLLPPEIRDSEVKISYAKLDFKKGNYEKSLLNLKKFKSGHYLQYIDISLYKLCNYYELKEFEEAFLEIDKLNHYLRNNKSLPRSHYILNTNFIKFYKNLLKFQTDPGKFDTGMIKKELENVKFVSSKKWLAEKIEELS